MSEYKTKTGLIRATFVGDIAMVYLPFSSVIREDFKAVFGDSAQWMDKAKCWSVHKPDRKTLEAWCNHADEIILAAKKAALENPPSKDYPFVTLKGENYELRGPYHPALSGIMRVVGGRFVGKDTLPEGEKPYWTVSVLDRAALDEQLPALKRLFGQREAAEARKATR